MRLQIDNLGKVAVTIEKDYWSIEKDYDKLTIVEQEGVFCTFISRKPVPAGTELTNRNYWIKFSSLKEEIVLRFAELSNTVQNLALTKYDKKQNGIPLEDLSSSVQASLQKADTALRPETAESFVQNIVDRLVFDNIYKKSEVYNKEEVNSLINGLQYQTILVDSLPQPSDNTINKLYLTPSANQKTTNIKDEWITILDNNVYKWECIGSTSVNLQNYYTKSETYNKSEIQNIISDIVDIFEAKYNSTTIEDIISAYNAGKFIVCNYTINDSFLGYLLLTGIITEEGYEAATFEGVLGDSVYSFEKVTIEVNNLSVWHKSGISLQQKLISGDNIKTVNNQSILGSGNIDVAPNDIFEATFDVTTYEEIVNALSLKKQVVVKKDGNIYNFGRLTNNTCFFATFVDTKCYMVDVTSENIWATHTTEFLNAANTQEKLVSGTNIKTVNNTSLLGEGNISITQTQADWNQTTTTAPDYIKNKPSIVEVNFIYPSIDNISNGIITDSNTLVRLLEIRRNVNANFVVIKYNNGVIPATVEERGSTFIISFVYKDKSYRITGDPTNNYSAVVTLVDKLFFAEYGVTTYSDVKTAYDAGKTIVGKYNDGTMALGRYGADNFWFYFIRTPNANIIITQAILDIQDGWLVPSSGNVVVRDTQVLTQAQYDALPTKYSETIYCII